MKCPKCHEESGDSWVQCDGICPLPMSPHYKPDLDRWGLGVEHHPQSVALMEHLMKVDFEQYGDHFCWKMGGDGDNGETLMYQMDSFFEAQDAASAAK